MSTCWCALLVMAKECVFTVNYGDGEQTDKEIKFADWDSELSGWDRFSNTDIRPPYVRDQVGYFFTHFHNGTKDRMTVDNYQFYLCDPVDPEKGLESIQLPDAPGINIMAISVATATICASRRSPPRRRR